MLIPILSGEARSDPALGQALIIATLPIIGALGLMIPGLILLIVLCNLSLFLINAYIQNQKRKAQRLRFREAQIAYRREQLRCYSHSVERKQQNRQHGAGVDSAGRCKSSSGNRRR